MAKTAQVEDTIEAWESRALGCDEEHTKVSDLNVDDLDEALGLQMISIRLQKGLIEELKLIAEVRHVPYQPLIKQILRRFVDSEMKMILKEAAERAKKEKSKSGADSTDKERQCA